MNEERQYKSPLQAVNKAYFDYPIADEDFKQSITLNVENELLAGSEGLQKSGGTADQNYSVLSKQGDEWEEE